MKLANTLTKLPAIVGGLSLFAASAHAAIVTFQPTRAGGNFGPIDTYGTIDNNSGGIQAGSTSIETVGGNGFEFFFYIADNAGNSNNTVGAHPNWGASSLGDDFPSGFTILITPLEVGDRVSTHFGAITATAPDVLSSSRTDGAFNTSWTNGSTPIANGAKIGWKIELTAIPEPSSALLCGLTGLFLLRRRR